MNGGEHWLAHYIPMEHLTFIARHHAAHWEYSRCAAELQWFSWAGRPEARQKQTGILNTFSPALICSSLPCELAVTVKPAAICRPRWPSTASPAAIARDLTDHMGVLCYDIWNEKTEGRHLDCLIWNNPPLWYHFRSYFGHVAESSMVCMVLIVDDSQLIWSA